MELRQEKEAKAAGLPWPPPGVDPTKLLRPAHHTGA